MLALPIIELFERGLPEALIFIWACYMLSKTKIEYKRFLLSSLVFSCVCYLSRLLPVQFGVNTILNIATLILLNIKINKIKIIKSIQISVFVFALEFICEIINMLSIKYIFRADLNYVFNHSNLKTLYGLPSLVLFIIGIVIVINVRAKTNIQPNIMKS